MTARNARRSPHITVDRIETEPMTAEQYNQAVDALARLILRWTTSVGEDDGATSGHPNTR